MEVKESKKNSETTPPWPNKKEQTSLSIQVIPEKVNWIGQPVIVIKGPKSGSVGRINSTASGWIEVHESDELGSDPFLMDLDQRTVLNKRAHELNLLRTTEDWKLGDYVIDPDEGVLHPITQLDEDSVVAGPDNVQKVFLKTNVEHVVRFPSKPPPESHHLTLGEGMVVEEDEEPQQRERDEDDDEEDDGNVDAVYSRSKRARRAVRVTTSVNNEYDSSDDPPRKQPLLARGQNKPAKKLPLSATAPFHSNRKLETKLEEGQRIRNGNLLLFLKKSKDAMSPNRECLQDWLEAIQGKVAAQEEDAFPLLFDNFTCASCNRLIDDEFASCWNPACDENPALELQMKRFKAL